MADKKEEARLHNEATLRSLEGGDLVHFDRGHYLHWTVYVGNEEVVEVFGGLDLREGGEFLRAYLRGEGRALTTLVRKATFLEVAHGCRADKDNGLDEKYTPLSSETVTERALGSVGERFEYDILASNCEHFVNWCRYDQWESKQADDLRLKVTVMTTQMTDRATKATEAAAKFVGETTAKTLIANLKTKQFPTAAKDKVMNFVKDGASNAASRFLASPAIKFRVTNAIKDEASKVASKFLADPAVMDKVMSTVKDEASHAATKFLADPAIKDKVIHMVKDNVTAKFLDESVAKEKVVNFVKVEASNATTKFLADPAVKDKVMEAVKDEVSKATTRLLGDPVFKEKVMNAVKDEVSNAATTFLADPAVKGKVMNAVKDEAAGAASKFLADAKSGKF